MEFLKGVISIRKSIFFISIIFIMFIIVIVLRAWKQPFSAPDPTVLKTVENYVHYSVSGNWKDALPLTVGPLQKRLKQTNMSAIQKGQVVDVQTVQTLKDPQNRYSEIRANITIVLDGSTWDHQIQTYRLTQEPEGWKIYDVIADITLEKDLDSTTEEIPGKEIVGFFIEHSSKGEWGKAKALLAGPALSRFESTAWQLPQHLNVTIENVQIEPLGELSDGSYLWEATYRVNQKKEITSLFELKSWNGTEKMIDTQLVRERDIKPNGAAP